MLTVFVLGCAAAPFVSSPGDAHTGDLRGVHLEITTVHNSAAMNMFDSDGGLLPWQEWRGFQRDVIDWVAAKAGFTYTLHLPSGEGEACAKNEDGSVQTPVHNTRPPPQPHTAILTNIM